jgi:hypothetical protein
MYGLRWHQTVEMTPNCFMLINSQYTKHYLKVHNILHTANIIFLLLPKGWIIILSNLLILMRATDVVPEMRTKKTKDWATGVPLYTGGELGWCVRCSYCFTSDAHRGTVSDMNIVFTRTSQHGTKNVIQEIYVCVV